MTWEIIFVFAVIGVAAALMASNRVRFDIVAVLVLLALMLIGLFLEITCILLFLVMWALALITLEQN